MVRCKGGIASMMKVKRISIEKVFIYIELFLIIFQSGSVYAATDHETVLFNVTRLMMMVIPMFMVLSFGINKVKQILLLFLGLQLATLVNLFLFPEGFLTLEYKLLLFLIFYLLIGYCHRRNINLAKYLYHVLLVIIMITLLIYIPVELLKLDISYSFFQGPDSFVVYRNYFNIFFSFSTKTIPRISGFFWEPGAYEIYINLAFFLYIMLKKNNKIQLFIIISSIIFCQSTMGWLIGIFLFGYLLLSGGWYNKHSKLFLILFTSIFVLVIAVIVFVMKRADTNVLGDSYYVRILDILHSLKVLSKNLLFGVGYGNTNVFMDVSNTIRGSSNGFLSWFYMTGLSGMVIVLYPFVRNSIRTYKEKKSYIWWIFTSIVVAFNFGEPFYNLPMMVFILAIAYFELLNPTQKQV